jgi:hypothetical protein
MVSVASIASRPLSILIGPGMPPPRQSSVAGELGFFEFADHAQIAGVGAIGVDVL